MSEKLYIIQCYHIKMVLIYRSMQNGNMQQVSQKCDSNCLKNEYICAILFNDILYQFIRFLLEVAHGTGKLAEV